MPSYSHVAGTFQDAASASMNVPYPAGSLSGHLILLIASVRDFNGATGVSTPSGFTLLAAANPGTNDSLWLYGRIGDGTESGTVAWDSATTAGQHAGMISFAPPTGYAWPAIGTAHVATSEGSSADGSSNLTYGARTISANGNLGIQIGKEPTTGTVTAVGTTAGFTQAFWEFSQNYVTAAQYREISGNISSNAVSQTGNSGTSTTVFLTAEFAPVVSYSISVDDSTIDPHPDTVVTITKSGGDWNGTVSATIEGTAITLTNINTTQKSFTLNISDLLPGGAWNAISPTSTATLTVTDSDGAMSTEVQIVFSPSTAEDYVASPGANIGTYLAVPGAVTGDPHFAFWHNGDGVRDKTIAGTTDAGTGYFAPVTLPSQGRLIAYDVSGAVWLAHVDTDYFNIPSSGIVEGIVMAVVRPIVKSVVEVIT